MSVLSRYRRARHLVRSAWSDAVHRLRGAPDGLPIPPTELHVLVSGNPRHGVAEYLQIGDLCADLVESLLHEEGRSLAVQQAILDFGCGCGRVLREVRRRTGATLFGTDVNADAIAWCRSNLPIADFRVNALEPPIGYSDAAFDLCYAFSVFTHLPEALARAWLDELARVLRPGGYLLITTQGEAYAGDLSAAERERLGTAGVVVRRAELPGSNRCLVYHAPSYVSGVLAPALELRAFRQGRILDSALRLVSQDAYLLRKPR